jgi:two-component sensor histidine kinase
MIQVIVTLLIINSSFYSFYNMKKVFKATLVTFLLLPLMVYSQQSKEDSLWLILKSAKVKKMTFSDLIAIQKDYASYNKKLRMAYSYELLGRRDLMANEKQKAEAYLMVAENFRFFGDNIMQSKAYFEESIKLFTKQKNLRKKAEAINLLGAYYQNIDEDSIAIKLYTESLQIAEKIKDTAGILRPYRGFVFIFTKMGLYDKAIAYGLEGIKRSEHFHKEISVAFLSNNTGNAYLQSGQFDLAIAFYKKALSINKDAENIVRNSSNIGNAYLYLNKIDSAAKYLNRVEVLLPQVKVPRAFIFAYSYIAKLRNHQKRYQQAIGYANEAIRYAKGYQLESISDAAYESLVFSYKKMNMPDSALVALENYWKIKQRFLETSRNKTVAQVEQKFHKYRNEKEIELKAAEIELLKKDLVVDKLLRNGALVMSILLALMAILYYNRYKLKQRTSEVLTIKNLEIEKQKMQIQTSLEEKDILLKELHHRVKNNLAIVSSLLRIQSNKLEDEKAIQAVRQGQQRIDAMSMIHQRLYLSDKITSINIKEYVNDLAESLMNAYGYNCDNFDLELAIESEELDVDLAMPMGLIINELLTNSFKYAYAKIQQPQLKISIKKNGGLILEIHDNGIGIDIDRWTRASDSFGKKLIVGLTHQLGGTYTIEKNNGTFFKLHIPKEKLKIAA